MYVDALLVVSDGQQVTATAVSTSSIDLGNVTPKRQIGDGEPVGFKGHIKANGTTTGSMVVNAISSAAAALSAPTVIGSVSLATADLLAGGEFFVFISDGTPKQQFIGLQYVVTGTVDTTIQAEGALDSMAGGKPVSYAKAFTVTG
jgi:hypothetical protein